MLVLGVLLLIPFMFDFMMFEVGVIQDIAMGEDGRPLLLFVCFFFFFLMSLLLFDVVYLDEKFAGFLNNRTLFFIFV